MYFFFYYDTALEASTALERIKEVMEVQYTYTVSDSHSIVVNVPVCADVNDCIEALVDIPGYDGWGMDMREANNKCNQQ
jgi:hypothetical protein